MTLLDGKRYHIICGNNREHYGLVGAVDAIITDPPYGAEVHLKERSIRDVAGHIAEMQIPFDQITESDFEDLMTYAATNVDGWALMFCQTEDTHDWRRVSKSYGTAGSIRYVRPMLWIKPDAKPNFRGNGPGIGHEMIVSLWCGNRAQEWNGRGQVGIFRHNRARTYDAKGKWMPQRHPTEKPVSLMKELVRLFTDPDDIIFDPFMGSGSTGVAALELGRRFIGIEKNPEYFAEAERRLAEAETPNLIFETKAKMPPLFGDTEFPGRRHNERLRKAAKEKGDAIQS